MHAAGSLLPAAVAWVWRFLSSSSSSLQLGTEILGFPLYIVVLLQLIAEEFQREGLSCRGCFPPLPIFHLPTFTLEDLELFPGTLLSALQLLDQLLIS
jgi:hypothetical protein